MNPAYYVTMIRDGKIGVLSGPYATHADALAQVEYAYDIACELDPRCAFDSRGTALIASDRPGALQRHGYPLDLASKAVGGAS